MNIANGFIDRIKSSSTDLDELLNIDLAICSALAETAQNIAVKESEYASIFAETLDYGYKMTMKKAEMITINKTSGDLPLSKRKFDVLEKLHEHVQARIKAVTRQPIS